MKMEYIDGLLHVSFIITYQEKTIALEHVIIDTGAARTIISADAVFDLGIFAAADDEINVMYGIGGEDYSFRKVVDEIEFAPFKISDFPIDFGDLDEAFGINGIIGLDVLLAGKFVIDLENMVIHQKDKE
ncbi:aspartyl protease family protein [Aneurinibacillus tyrosinisolvens]|uniref:aspartyl protease family protein n=1 Tax=Aneurinibacillus tyrosinisolvens TaxID=1443435 RepID=UPI00063F7BAA|nr:aspartyl protease family protein [Aneurinibacillus tyrosinisolvens]